MDSSWPAMVQIGDSVKVIANYHINLIAWEKWNHQTSNGIVHFNWCSKLNNCFDFLFRGESCRNPQEKLSKGHKKDKEAVHRQLYMILFWRTCASLLRLLANESSQNWTDPKWLRFILIKASKTTLNTRFVLSLFLVPLQIFMIIDIVLGDMLRHGLVE